MWRNFNIMLSLLLHHVSAELRWVVEWLPLWIIAAHLSYRYHHVHWGPGKPRYNQCSFIMPQLEHSRISSSVPWLLMSWPQGIDCGGYKHRIHWGKLPSFIHIILNPLQWRHIKRNGVSNQRRLDYLFNRLFRHRAKKPLKPRVTGICAGNSPVTGEFPALKVSNAENVSIWWRHHAINALALWWTYYPFYFFFLFDICGTYCISVPFVSTGIVNVKGLWVVLANGWGLLK